MHKAYLFLGLTAIFGLTFTACGGSDETTASDATGGSGGSAGAAGQGGAAGTGGAAGQGGSAGTAGQGAAGTGGAAGQGGSTQALEGLFAIKTVMTSTIQAPVIGALTNVSTTILRVEQTVSGSNITMKMTTCSFKIDTGSTQVQIEVPDAYVSSIGERVAPGTFVSDGKGGVTLTVPTFYSVYGAKLTDPTKDPLPADKADAKVVDQDGDGHPGMTLKVSGMALITGDLYVVQRASYAFAGTSSAADAIDGLVTWNMEQNILDTTNAALKLLPQSKPDADPSKSTFKHRKLSATQDCAAILADEANIFH